MPVGELLVRIAASTAEFKSDLGKAVAAAEVSSRQIDRAVGKIGVSVKSALANTAGSLGLTFGVAGTVAFVKSAIDSAEALSELSDRSGVAVETLAGLEFAATQTGASTEAFATALKFLNRNIAEAGQGNQEFSRLFKDLGLTDEAKCAGTALDAFLKLSEVFPRLNSAQQTAVSMKLLGRSGEELKVALAGGPEALKALIEEGQRLNPITTELAKQADAFNDNLAKIGITIKSSTYPALNSLLKPANELLDIASSKEVGGGLSGLFASLFGNADLNAKQLEDPGKALQALTKKIDVLKQRANLDIGGVQLKLAEAQKQLLQQEQRKRALAGTDGLDEGREGRGRVKTNIHITTDEEIAAAKKAEQVAEAARKRAKDFIADLEKQRDTLGVSEEAQKSYEASVLSTSLAAGKERDAFIASTKARIDDIKAQKELDEFRQQINKNIEEGVEAQKKWTEAIQDSVEKEQELLDEQLKANEVFGKTKAEIIDLTIARKEAALAAGEAAHLTEEETSALSQQIEVLKRRKNAVVKGETLEKDKKAYEDFFSSVESAGKEAFRNFGEEGVSVTERLKNALKESVYDMLYQLTVKKWLINIETAISGSDGGESSGFNWASLIGMFGGGGEASAADFYAKGGAFEGGVERYATGGIVSRPTLFRMANGAGLMGEAGPEGILPLQRMGDGRLGVSTSGLDGSAGITIIQNNTFQGGADKATLAAWAAQVKQETMRAVSSEIARNGPMAKVVRSA